MFMYLYSFGQQHEAKLLYAFENMDKSVWESDEIAVVDYGCGQGLATMVLADFMRKNDIDSSKINRVTLIEPSEKCLKRAALHTSCFLQSAEIRCVNKYINDLCDEDIKNEEPIPTIHLFSNIIDIVEVDLGKLSNLLKKCKNDYDQYICVGPMLNVDRLDSFAYLLGFNVFLSQNFDSNEFKADKSWTCVVRTCVNNSQGANRLSHDIDELDCLIM